MPPKVLATRILPEAAVNILRQHCELEVHSETVPLSKAQLIAKLSDKAGLVCQLTQVVDAEVLAAALQLRVVANVAVGYDNIDVAVATSRRIAVTNTPGVLDETVADFTWALLLAAARRVVEADQFVRSGAWRGWDLHLLLGTDIHGKTLGIYGFGRIGRCVARRACGFAMRTLYCDPMPAPPEVEQELKAQRVDRETLLREADFLSLHLPLTPQTYHCVSQPEFALMKPTAILVNIARGPIVDEAALVEALEQGKLAGAALDVFEDEPRVQPKLLTMKNVVLAPHLGSAAVETRTRMAVMAAENAVAVLKGERPPNIVNPEIYT